MKQRGDIFFFCQSSQKEQNPFVIRNAESAAQCRRVRRVPATVFFLLKAGRDDGYRCIDPVRLQQPAHFFGGDDYGVHPFCNAPGKALCHGPPNAHAGGKIMRIVLVNRVIGMNERDFASPCDQTRNPEGVELALTVDDIRVPADQFTQNFPGAETADPDARIEPSRAKRTDADDSSLCIAVNGFGQRQNLDLMAALLQSVNQRKH